MSDNNLLDQVINQDGVERRYLPAEFRANEDGTIEGYAAVFDKWSEDLGFFKERIRAGAFKKTIRESDIRALFNHDPNYVLGRNAAGTLELEEDDHGLHMVIDPPNAGWADDLQVSIKRGDIDQGSFGFKTIKDEWDHNAEPAERELIELSLFDVSVVTYPAYPQTSVSARTLGEMFIARVQAAGQFGDVDLLLEQLNELLTRSGPGQESHVDQDQLDEDQVARARADIRKRQVELQRLNLL